MFSMELSNLELPQAALPRVMGRILALSKTSTTFLPATPGRVGPQPTGCISVTCLLQTKQLSVGSCQDSDQMLWRNFL